MMWGFLQSCCAKAGQIVGYRFYSDDSVQMSEAPETMSLFDDDCTLSITEAPEHLQAELTRDGLTLSDEPETLNMNDCSESTNGH